MTTTATAHHTNKKQRGNPKPSQSVSRRAVLLRAALSFAERGILVFPLKPGGKTPLTPNGHLDATTDPRRIHAWWNRWPDANIGMPTGKRSKLLVIDEDTYRGGNLDALVAEHGKLPDTTTTRTGRGGRQYILKYPAGVEIRNSADKLGPGLDVRGEGGYIVVPPSRTEGPYEWLNRHAPAHPPEWLLEVLREEPRSAERYCEDRPALSAELNGQEIPEGRRNDTLTRIAGALRARGLELEDLETELQAVNSTRCTPPLEASEVAGVARSVCKYPAGDAAPEPPREVLRNVDVLFTRAREHLEWRGMAGATDRAVYVALLLTARRHGRLLRSGIKVYISVRALALLAGTSRPTVIKALDRLKAQGLVRRASEGHGNKAGALVLRVPQVFTTQPVGEESLDSGKGMRDVVRELLRLRYGPGRVGKTGAHLLELVARSALRSDSATVGDLVAGTGRRRDNVRRSLRKLEARALVECSGENVRLVAGFAAALERELEVSRITRSERLDRDRYERERQGYAALLKDRRRGRNAYREYLRAVEADKKPDGYISELERVEGSEELESPGPTPTAASEPAVVITNANDSDQFRELVAQFRRKISEYRRNLPQPTNAERASRLYRRLRQEDRECFDALRHDYRKLAWEVAGRGWTTTVYCGNTTRAALELLDRERVAA